MHSVFDEADLLLYDFAQLVGRDALGLLLSDSTRLQLRHRLLPEVLQIIKNLKCLLHPLQVLLFLAILLQKFKSAPLE